MRRLLDGLTIALVLISSAPPALGQSDQAIDEVLNLPWVIEPGVRTVPGADATYRQSDTQMWVDGQDAVRALTLAEGTNQWDAVVGLAIDFIDETQIVIQDFDIGYIDDDDWGDFDPAVVLSALREATEDANTERRRNGYPTLQVLGYAVEPRYDPTLDAVYWAVRVMVSTGDRVINAVALKLSRDGFSSITWVGSVDQFTGRETLEVALAPYSFDQGARYADFRAGDAVAGVGLATLATRLITGRDAGGAGRAAATGLLAVLVAFAKKAWFLLLVPFLFIGRLFRRRKTSE